MVEGGAEARLTVCGRDGRGTCDSGFGILFSLDRDEKLSRNKGRNRCAGLTAVRAPPGSGRDDVHIRPTRLPLFWAHAHGDERGLWHMVPGQKAFLQNTAGIVSFGKKKTKKLSISASPVSPENILALIINIEKYEDKLGKSQDAIVTIPFYLYLLRKCQTASEICLFPKCLNIRKCVENFRLEKTGGESIMSHSGLPYFSYCLVSVFIVSTKMANNAAFQPLFYAVNKLCGLMISVLCGASVS